MRFVGVLGLLVALPAAADLLDPPARYRVSGRAAVTIAGPGCCGDERFTGSFQAEYQLDSAGGARLNALGFRLDDRDVFVQGGFLDLFSSQISVRCASGAATDPALGTVDGAVGVRLPAGSVSLRAWFSNGLLADGSCNPEGIVFEGTNSADVLVTQDAVADRVLLDSTFSGTRPEGTFVAHLTGEGRFDDRPPQATLAFRYPDGLYHQMGCPAFWHWSGQLWERVAEANGPGGLTGSFVSRSGDPDGWAGRNDIFADTWYQTRGSAPRAVLGQAREVGPLVFEWGPVHTVELLTSDYAGATDAANCGFRVVDTKPPVVTAPPPRVLSCSTAGGATAATSPSLAAFLAGAVALDGADATPTALPPQLGTTDVTPSTLFPADGIARTVRFRFADDWGNSGSATSTLTVRDTTPPAGGLNATPSVLPPDGRYWAINVVPSLSDDCGPWSVRLVSIRSNAPAFDAHDVVDASYGTDDRLFWLFARLAGPGLQRKYTITYEAKDPAGNSRLLTTIVRVG